jgi:hypothetical protein
MPANEQTWREIPLLHKVFAGTGLLLLVATVWVFWNDQRREWRTTQALVVRADTTMNRWRQQQYATDTAMGSHQQAAHAKLQVDAEFVDPEVIAQFEQEVARYNAEMEKLGDSKRLRFDAAEFNSLQQQQAQLSQTASQAWQEAAEAKRKADTAQREYVEMRSAAKKDNDETVRQAADAADKAQQVAAEAEAAAIEASNESASMRNTLVQKLSRVVTEVRGRENIILGERKFKSADLDAAKAGIDIGVRDGLPKAEMDARYAKVAELQAEFDKLNENYQKKNESRLALQKLLTQATARQAEAAGEYQESLAGLETLKKQYAERDQSYFTSYDSFPWIGPGKKILNLPVLNAFNSPQKIENLWSEGLVQNYNFRTVRRFDRCTTCHQAMQRSLPGSPTDPAYIHENEVAFWISPPEAVLPASDEGATEVEKLEATFGMRLADEGIINFDDVTVSLVLPESAAAKAQRELTGEASQPVTGEALREHVAQFSATPNDAQPYKVLPGLLPGDVLVRIGDTKVAFGRDRAATMLLDSVGTAQPVRVVVRRGLTNPYTTHPRLDLFVGDASPHPMGTFGCTICHEGQGSATAFKWASHTPNDSPENPNQSEDWARKYGWFDNHHWIYPMYPERFAEAACLKCHHQVVELEASEKFPEPPAPKVTHGYHLIRKYGCYGCHEVNGFDGPDRSIGPDLRLEPNFYAASLQLGHLLPERLTHLEQSLEQAKSQFEELHNVATDNLSDAEKAAHSQKANAAEAEVNRLTLQTAAVQRALELTPDVASRNYDVAARRELLQFFTDDAAITEPAKRAFSAEQHRTANVLKDVEAPGDLRKPGPTLRFVRSKLDSEFLYDWTANPRSFRPDTRMPRFFGLWDHLEGEPASKELAHDLEPVEIHGIVAYLNQTSQSFVPVEKPPGITESTVEERRERGRIAFETRGCLACHQHNEFDDAPAFRGEKEIVQGPNLSALAAKFDSARNPQGREWLYSWIKDPTRYNVRTLMPNLYLDPIASKDPDGNAVVTDPVDDIVEFLLDPAHSAQEDQVRDDKQAEAGDGSDSGDGNEIATSPAPDAHGAKPWKPTDAAREAVNTTALKNLMLQYLAESFPQHRLDGYYENGLPERMREELKVAEQELVVGEGEKLTDEQRLAYIGRKSISKFGCYGCHDIPGFEDAKPIGTGLADWGRKDPSRLAFEHISHYLEHGHGHGAGPAPETQHDAHAAQVPGDNRPPQHTAEAGHSSHDDTLPDFYKKAVMHGSRAGFIFQKLREPRSYDYMKTANKKYNDRLRMPEFPFNNEEREAVVTFVLGLVAEPPTEKYLYQGDERKQAIAAGKQVLETYNCGGCHVLEAEQWKLSFPLGTFDEQSAQTLPPFVGHHFDPQQLSKSATPDRRGETQATLYGLPALDTADALPQVRDADDEELEPEAQYSPNMALYGFDLYEAVALGGNPYRRGLQPLQVPGTTITTKYPSLGGFLAKYLAPRVLELERQDNPKAPGNEAYGWLPPPLMGEGAKVQTEWLYEFLREPYAIRPATFLRMPKFNLSPDDTTKLVNYFAARDNAEYPYMLDTRRQSNHLAARQAEFERAGGAQGPSEEAGAQADPSTQQDRLDAAMAIVTKTQCVQCHQVGDYVPTGPARAQGPNLARVYERLRPDYTRQWLANPKMFLPYTPMPVNIFKYDPQAENLGGLDQALYHGTSVQQLDGVVDLLMNYDEYAKRQTRISELVPPQPAGAPAEEPPAEASNGGDTQ